MAAEGRTALRADIEFDRILDPAVDPPMFVHDIEGVYWNTPSSGIEISEAAAAEVKRRWAAYLQEIDGPGLPDIGPAEAGTTASAGATEYQQRTRLGIPTFQDRRRSG